MAVDPCALPRIIIATRFIATLCFFNDTATTEIYTLSLHDALPILAGAVEFNGLISLSPNQFSMAGTLKAGPIETAVKIGRAHV